jgi:hypothetical protein
MIATLGLTVVYFKALSIGTYLPMIWANYKYTPLEHINKHEIVEKYENKLTSKFPRTVQAVKFIGMGLNKSCETIVQIVLEQIKSYKKIDVCPKKLSKALIHTSISYKLLIPAYIGISYSLAKRHFDKQVILILNSS